LENAIKTVNLTKNFGDLVAVDHVSFEVQRGEIFGFLGPNGAGKTTTIRMLTGVIKPDDGSATIMGYDIQSETLKAKQMMGIVPEMSNAYTDLSAWNNLMLIGELYGVHRRERRERAEKLLKEFGLYERKDQLVRSYSKGMKQKLLLCMALINEPQILFLDEPTSGLDVESARLIRDMIRNLNKSGATIFLSTHNMEEANQLCEKVAIINHGKIAAIDSPEKLRIRSSGLRSVEVSFDKPIDLENLQIIGVREVRKTGDKVRLYVDEPGEVIVYLADYARLNGLKIVSLNTLAPTLEDVFIKLIKTN
jgi:ABC-2 type transport system ATP-binding protein